MTSSDDTGEGNSAMGIRNAIMRRPTMVNAWNGNQSDEALVLVADTLYSRRQLPGGWSVWSIAQRLPEANDTECQPAWEPESEVTMPEPP